MARKRAPLKPERYLAVLPEETLNMDFSNGEIHWEIKDKSSNESIIFSYDLHTKFAYWDSFDNEAAHGRYKQRIFTPDQLEKATEEWYTAKENWTI